MSNNSGMGTGRMKDDRSTKEAVVTLLVWPRRDKKRRQRQPLFWGWGGGRYEGTHPTHTSTGATN